MRAVLSVSDKSGLVDFARGLVARSVELVSTGGTQKDIADAGLPVMNVSEVTGFPEMMDGRVKTLHPKIHAGILARRDRQDDLDAIKSQGVKLVDFLVVNLYPFAATAADPTKTFDDLIEKIDIGGPSLVRAAAKNWKFVYVVTSPNDYDDVLGMLDAAPAIQLYYRFELMRKAFRHTAEYDMTIAKVMDNNTVFDTETCEAVRTASRPATS